MTILEVMFAIMITTIGLLGAVAVFPVASEYARKGRLNDEVTVCAESAVHTMDARSMRRPDRWLMWRYLNGGITGTPFFLTGTSLEQQFSPPTPPNIVRAGINPGESYCLDPRFVAANLMANSNPPPAPVLIPNYGVATWFPASPRPANTGPNDPNNTNGPGAPRMQRITLANGAAVFPMGQFQADFVFSFEDQLAYERPGVQKGSIARNDNALPAFQLYSPIKDPNNPLTIYPGKREDDGKLSWIATLVPKIDRWNATLEDKYVLSVVVFYSRSRTLTIEDPSATPTRPVNEWTAKILGNNASNVSDFHSSGYGGGEVTISADNAGDLNIRAGDWVMLSGHVMARNPATDTATTVPTFKWYKVSDCDEDPYEFPAASGNWKRDVTLVGPDWDLQDVLPLDNTGAPNPGNSGFDDVEVTIVPGIVAVFDRTVRLELDGTGF